MLDACLAYQLVDEGGVIVFDDYLWDLNRPLLDTPKMALDMFTTLYREKVSIVMMNFQLAVVKIK
jgi:hypothetical protein